MAIQKSDQSFEKFVRSHYMYKYIWALCLGEWLPFHADVRNAQIVYYRRTGFKCEHVIIANCDFSPSTQLLECNVYIMHSINQCVARA